MSRPRGRGDAGWLGWASSAALAPLHAQADSVLAPAGTAAASIALLSWVLLAGGTAVLAAVMLLLGAAVLGGPRHRLRRALQARPLAWIVGGGIVLPAALLGPLLVDSVLRAERLAARPGPGALVVGLTARMWWWELRYPHPGGGPDVIAANELRLPAGRDVRLALASADVIHSFWVPALAGKMDMLPGRLTHLNLHATRPGVYRAQCAEYCGEQHARMALRVVVLPPAEFDAWLAHEARPAAAPARPAGQRGRDAFVQLRCGACHSVRGLVEGAHLGPDLTHVGGRLTLGAGLLPNDAEAQALRAWIAGVQDLKPGAHMPSYGALDEATLDALAAYLASLR
jgi:cytochrome c oxidase subunit 2